MTGVLCTHWEEAWKQRGRSLTYGDGKNSGNCVSHKGKPQYTIRKQNLLRTPTAALSVNKQHVAPDSEGHEHRRVYKTREAHSHR